jgi:peptidoglycan hydrolase-like protein with peptidoglycan-binding domain
MSLKEGAVSDAVAEVQNALSRKGINAGPPNGLFGPQTEQAVRTFQGQHGLAVTGVVDQATWQALGLPGSVSDGHGID